MNDTTQLSTELDEFVSDLDQIAKGDSARRLGTTVDFQFDLWFGRAIDWVDSNLGTIACMEFSKKASDWRASKFTTKADACRAYLLALGADIVAHPDVYMSEHAAATARGAKKTPRTPLDELEQLLSRFHTVAVGLRRRYDNREPFRISDEFDVQYLLGALLRSRFDDVRDEEPSPSRGGSASRIDFLIKNQQIAVEAKFATAKLRDKQIGEQLIIDIERYQSHPNCRALVCFVYDPDSVLENPTALIGDLAGTRDELDVRVIVSPAR